MIIVLTAFTIVHSVLLYLACKERQEFLELSGKLVDTLGHLSARITNIEEQTKVKLLKRPLTDH